MIRSDEDYGLRIRNLEFGAAARIRTEQHVVDPNHIITRFCEFGAVKLAGASRQFFLSGTTQPSDLEFAMLTALWTRVSRRFCFLLFVVKISFVHNERSVHPKFILTRAKFPISNQRGAICKRKRRVGTNGMKRK